MDAPPILGRAHGYPDVVVGYPFRIRKDFGRVECERKMAVLDDKFSRSVTLLKELRPGTKNVNCQFIVIDKGTTNRTKDGSTVRKCRVADRSGSICFSLWNEQAAAIEAGDILRLIKGYTSLWKGTMVLYSGKYGKLEKIGEFTMLYSEMPDMSSHDHDFLPKQQQKKSPQPGGGPSDRSSEHGPLPTQPTGNGRTPVATGQPSSNSRMGITTHASGTGNWNGNNHHSNDSLPAPLPPDQQAPPLINHNRNGPDKAYPPHPQPRHTHHSDTRETSSYSRGHTRTSNVSSHVYDRPHPYQRPPPSSSSHSLALDPSLTSIRPASYRATHSLMQGDLRAPPPQLR